MAFGSAVACAGTCGAVGTGGGVTDASGTRFRGGGDGRAFGVARRAEEGRGKRGLAAAASGVATGGGVGGMSGNASAGIGGGRLGDLGAATCIRARAITASQSPS
ncbi:MAG TPA: hypothetical protein VKZ18_07445 [Polyangia bacterium]|nr:hypothetical protein [Polyangia bacterium]